MLHQLIAHILIYFTNYSITVRSIKLNSFMIQNGIAVQSVTNETNFRPVCNRRRP